MNLFEQYGMESFGYGFEFDGLVEQLESFSGSGDSCYSSYNEYSCLDEKISKQQQQNKNTNCLSSARSSLVESPESESFAPPPPPPSRPAKLLKTNTGAAWNPTTTTAIPPTKPCSASNSTSQIISFDNSTNSSSLPPPHPHPHNSNYLYALDSSVVIKPKSETITLSTNDNLDFSTLISHQNPKAPLPTITRNSIQAQDHVMAERKRREKLSQRFIALSAILPGLKKVFYLFINAPYYVCTSVTAHT